MADKPKVLVPAGERSRIARAVLLWLNGCPDKPCKRVEYEYIGDVGLAVSTVQAPYKLRQYIDGSYQAQYLFALTYCGRPTTNDARLGMDEALNRMAEWCMENAPELGEKILIQRCECSQASALTARYDDGTEAHQVQMNIIYEVN